MEKNCQRSHLINIQVCAMLSLALMLVCSHYVSEAMSITPTLNITEPSFKYEAPVDSAATKITLQCTFYYLGPNYLCILRKLNLTTEAEVTAVSGKHTNGRTNADVRGIHFQSGKMFFLPSGIEKFFPNLNSIVAGDEDESKLSFRNIKRSSLSKLNKLTMLSIFSDKITKVVDDAFWDLPMLRDLLLTGNGSLTLHENAFQKNTYLRDVVFLGIKLKSIPANLFRSNTFLETVYFTDCSLKSINESLFEANTKLAEASFNSNLLANLPKYLFKNNLLLEVIDFSENRLKTIDIDFTKFHFIDSIDLQDNVCIDAFYENDGHVFDGAYTNLTEVQNLVKANCSSHLTP